MDQSSIYAAVKDVQIIFRREEYALGMEQRSSNAAAKDAPTKLGGEECALGMEQRSSDAAAKDAPTKLRGEVCARDMEQIALFTKVPLPSDQNTRRLPQLQPYPIRASFVLYTTKVMAFLER